MGALTIVAQDIKPKTHTAKYSLNENNTNKYTLTILTEENFDQQPHLGEEVSEDIRYQKSNGVIKLPLAYGKYYIASDSGVPDGSSDSYVLHEYIGQLNSANYYLIQIQGYETMSYNLIDKSTGEEKNIDRMINIATFTIYTMSSMSGW